MGILGTLRLNRSAGVRAPDYLVGGGLDLLALEEILTPPVAGKVNDFALALPEGPGDGEENRVAQATPRQQHRLVLRNVCRRTGGAHDDHRVTEPQGGAQP